MHQDNNTVESNPKKKEETTLYEILKERGCPNAGSVPVAAASENDGNDKNDKVQAKKIKIVVHVQGPRTK